MSEPNTEINIMELLLKISNDVSSIKTDMTNFKEAQAKQEKETAQDIEDVHEDCKKEVKDLETKVMDKITVLETVQKGLVLDVDSLKHADEKKDAKRWRLIMAFVGTAIGGMVIGKLPEIISTLANILTSK